MSASAKAEACPYFPFSNQQDQRRSERPCWFGDNLTRAFNNDLH